MFRKIKEKFSESRKELKQKRLEKWLQSRDQARHLLRQREQSDEEQWDDLFEHEFSRLEGPRFELQVRSEIRPQRPEIRPSIRPQIRPEIDSIETETDSSTEYSSDPEPEPKPEICCRICRDEDEVSNFVTPCQCDGSLQYVHTHCLNQWRIVRQNRRLPHSVCEICRSNYQILDGFPTDRVMWILILAEFLGFYLSYSINQGVVFSLSYLLSNLYLCMYCLGHRASSWRLLYDWYLDQVNGFNRLIPVRWRIGPARNPVRIFLLVSGQQFLSYNIVGYWIGWSNLVLICLGYRIVPDPYNSLFMNFNRWFVWFAFLITLLSKIDWWNQNIRDYRISSFSSLNIENHEYPPAKALGVVSDGCLATVRKFVGRFLS